MITVRMTRKEKYQAVRFDYKPTREALEQIKALGGRWEAPHWVFRMTQEEFEAKVLPTVQDIAQRWPGEPETIGFSTDEDRAELAQLLEEW